MTAHELARQLLEGPDLIIGVEFEEHHLDGDIQITDCDIEEGQSSGPVGFNRKVNALLIHPRWKE